MTVDRRPRTPLVFGEGIDRDVGIMATRPGQVEDVRNFTLHGTRAVLRQGHSLTTTLDAGGSGGVTHVIGGRSLRSEGIGVVVAYSQATGAVTVFRVEPDLSATELVGEWFSLAPESPPPRVWLAESFGRMFLAHDHSDVIERAPTFVYDFLFAEGDVLRPIEANFDETEPQPIKFRGVVSHLDYLFGWGYGSEFEDRPELVRSSLPGQPEVFRPQHYFVAGDRRDPVLQCVPGARDLVVLKGAEWHAITGYDRRTFGIQIRDPLNGLLLPGLAVNVSGSVFFWSPEGPKVTDGEAPAQALEIPLDLLGFQPQDLVERGTPALAWYVPGDRVVIFAFGRRGYALSVRDSPWRWSYWPLGFQPYSAFMLHSTDAAGDVAGPPTGYPTWDDATAGGTFADIEIGNVNQRAGDVLEIWVSPVGEFDYTRLATVTVSPSATQTERVSGLEEASVYDGALRYRRGVHVAEAYSGPPETWPEVSRGQFSTTIDPPEVGVISPTIGDRFAFPVLDPTQRWERLDADTEVHRFLVTPAYSGSPIRIYRRESPSGSFALIETITDSRTEEASFTYETEIPSGEVAYLYAATTWVDPVESPQSAGLRLWAGPVPEGAKFVPPNPHVQSVFVPAEKTSYQASWVRGPADAPNGPLFTEAWDNLTGDSGPGSGPPSELRHTGPPVDGLEVFDAVNVTGLSNLAGNSFVISLRRKFTSFGVDDFSEFIGRGVAVNP